ncbi:MAG: PAS domain S-box protein [Nitrospinae bacterium]|nr:PAS domain S-box protein [Nitrospinota bacterium]
MLKSGRHDRPFYEELWKTIKAGRVWRNRIVNRRKDGSLYDEEMTISPIADASGAIMNFVAVKRDVTREAALQKSRAYFTDITAHELRTPLTKLHLVENMLKQIETAGSGERIGDVRNALLESMAAFDRIVNATTLISDMTRTGAEKPLVRDFIYYDIAAALENTQSNIEGARRDIRIETDMAGIPRHAIVMGNRGMIKQALDEVLSNAVKFTPDGKTISVRAYSGGGLVHIEVADEGEGIPEDKLRDVFIPYYSLESSLKHSTGRYKFHGGGMGLGLTMAKLIMEYHNGTLAIANRADGAGASVVLNFPLASDENPPPSA